MKTTLKTEGYAYLFYDVNQYHVLYNIETGEVERWTANLHHASFRLNYKNTHLEFCNSYNPHEKDNLMRTMLKVQRWGEQHPDSNSTMMNVYRKYIAK